MTYDQALTEYVAARDHLAQWGDQPGPAADVARAEQWLTQAALTLAQKVAEREGR